MITQKLTLLVFHAWMKYECNNLCKNGFMEDFQKVIFHEWMPYEYEKFCKNLFCMKATNADEYNLCKNVCKK